MKRIADDTKRIADGTKQNKKRQKHMEKKEEKWSKSRASERMVDRFDQIVRWSTDVIRFGEDERERFFITKTQ
ncbi:hypothetical protein T12_8762 [Trichinella patagoniensis]|uniref:Uncharacterized protein n=1 Tax=Trichinella patagoniensis TaxID=990121 RepID=A0A0V0ZWA7_9BILA|nr:hypothetical protein T12_8762 [Trichinella patagoniensis]